MIWHAQGARAGGGRLSGALGHGGNNHQSVPRLVEALAGEKVIGGAGGLQHSVVFTEAGELFTFGWGQYWKLGHGGDDDEWVPRLVQGEWAGKKVAGVAAGGCHTVVFTEAGDLYTFGDGRHGRLGHGGTDDESVPRLVEGLAGQRVVSATAGENFTAVATERGEVFCFGRLGGYAHWPEHHTPVLVRSLLN